MARANNNGRHKGMSYTRYGYIFIAPFVVVYCIFSLLPLLTTFWYSITNSQQSTADFWGFGSYEAYYDRYLDITKYYSDLKAQGIDNRGYNMIKSFFILQDYVDEYDPLNKKGVEAIIENGANNYVSQGTIDQLKQCLENDNLSYLSEDGVKELETWTKNSGDLYTLIQGKINSINAEVTKLIATDDSSEEETSTEDVITAESIITSDDFTTFIDTLSTSEFTADQKALMNYLASKTDYATLPAYFQAVKDGDKTIEDATFYYVLTNLNKPNALGADNSAVDAISVPFIGDVEKYLSANVWNSLVQSLNSYSKFTEYGNGELDLHDSQDVLYEDLQTLHNAGIINIVTLVVNGDTCVESTAVNKAENILAAFKSFVDTDYKTNPVENLARSQAGYVVSYMGFNVRKEIISLGYAVDQYVTFSGSFNTDKYFEYKSLIGMKDSLTYDKYKELDAARKAENVEKAKADLAKQETALEDAKAALAAAKGTDGEEAAQGKLNGVNSKIFKDKMNINYPEGILEKADATQEYISIGLQNFVKVFTHRNTFNRVVSVFYNTAVLWVIGFIPQILLALLLSAWFTDTKLHLKGLGLMKALMYLPNVITAVTVAIFFQKMFGYSTNAATYTPIQRIIVAFGNEPFNFFRSIWATRLIVCFINFWMWYGNTMIVLIAGITSISESLYESAQIDGANSVQTYTKITMPLLRPIILYTLVTSLIGGLQMFDIPANLNSNPVRVDFMGTQVSSIQTVLMYINAQAFASANKNHVGVAAAVSVLLFIVTTLLSILIFYIMRDKDAAKAKKLLKKGGTK